MSNKKTTVKNQKKSEMKNVKNDLPSGFSDEKKDEQRKKIVKKTEIDILKAEIEKLKKQNEKFQMFNTPELAEDFILRKAKILKNIRVFEINKEKFQKILDVHEYRPDDIDEFFDYTEQSKHNEIIFKIGYSSEIVLKNQLIINKVIVYMQGLIDDKIVELKNYLINL